VGFGDAGLRVKAKWKGERERGESGAACHVPSHSPRAKLSEWKGDVCRDQRHRTVTERGLNGANQPPGTL
jgi:hypothetical protein